MRPITENLSKVSLVKQHLRQTAGSSLTKTEFWRVRLPRIPACCKSQSTRKIGTIETLAVNESYVSVVKDKLSDKKVLAFTQTKSKK